MKSKRGKGIAMTFFTLGFVALFVGGVYIYIQKEVEPTVVYEFARDIPVNTKLEASDLREVSTPGSSVRDTMVLDKDDIVGKYNNTKVFNGSFVVKDNLVKKEDVDPFESIDLTKLRMITIPASYEDALGGDIKRGDRVDLIYVGQESKEDKEFTYAKTFLKNVLVYSTNTDDGYQYVNRTQSIKGEEYEEGDDINAESETGGLGTVTLALTLNDAEEVSSRMKTGDVQIIGRFLDSQDYDTAGYVNGDYEKIFSGTGNAETSK